MTREDIIRMAREAGGYPAASTDRALLLFSESHLERFAAMVATAEREACLALHDHEDVLAPIGASAWGEAYQAGWAEGTAAYREAIRARGQA